jgi:hypothetical protein
MSIEDLLQKIDAQSLPTIIFLCCTPVVALALNAVVNISNFNKGLKYVYTCLIYMASIPGIIALLLSVYAFFFLRQNMLQVNVLVYFLPIICLVLTLYIIKRKVNFNNIPGFEKLSSLFLFIAVSLILAYLIQKTNIYIGIFAIASIKNVFMLFAFIFAVLYFSWKKMMR